jgi:hypothetical protein
MDYKQVYDRIISFAVKRNLPKKGITVVETHHIIPKSCGGSNQKNNLVTLIPKEHYLCHLLLERIYRGTENHTKMQRAAFMMGRCGTKTSRSYQIVKEAHITNLKSQIISDKQILAIKQKNKGNKSRTGLRNSVEMNEKIGKGNKGKIRTAEVRALWSEQRTGHPAFNKGQTGELSPLFGLEKPKLQCPHCQKEGGKPAMIRHHFDNCKYKEYI